jgi:hypothetical protein
MEPVKASRVIGLVYVALLLLVLGLLLAALGIDVRWLADIRAPAQTTTDTTALGAAAVSRYAGGGGPATTTVQFIQR